MVEGADGNLYGTATADGEDNGDTNCSGTVFNVSTMSPYPITGLDWFNCEDTRGPGTPEGQLFIASDGNYYGTTLYDDDGAVYSISSASPYTMTTLYVFPESGLQGYYPRAGVVQGNDGNFYGTTFEGGANNYGTIYKIAVSPALPAPVQVSLSATSINVGASATLSWKVLNAFSDTMQICNGFVTSGGVTTPLGRQAGTYNSSTLTYSGSTTIKPTTVSVDTYAITCGGIESGLATLTVGPTTATSLTATPNPATVGETVTLKATVTGSDGTPTGDVSFYYASDLLDTATLSSGAATYSSTTNGLPVGTYSLTADYAGSTTYNSSVSAALPFVLNAAPTATALTSSATTVTPPASVTLTATVKRSASGAAGTPTGSVAFYTGASELGTAALNASGVATLTGPTTGIAEGKYSVTAKYSGDASDVASTSSAITINVE
jgi:uncharacterized repeat protein (TIGR03803 family)